MQKCVFLFSSFLFAISLSLNGQSWVIQLENPINTAFPFLTVTPDAGISGMGDAGAATLSPGNVFINASANAFIPDSAGMALDYKRSGNALLGLNGYKRKGNSVFAGGLRYSSLGGTTVVTNFGSTVQTSSNFEMALDANYVCKLTRNFAMGASVRYVYTTLSRGSIINGIEIKPVNAVVGDISMMYRTPIPTGRRESQLGLGLVLANLGGKVDYGYPGYQLFVPSMMRFGVSLETPTSAGSSFAIAVELRKLLVPTISISEDAGLDAMIGSFNDAPGGWEEELHEVTIGTGLEYRFEQRIFFRGGYFYEHPTKGGRTYYSLGSGFTYQNAALNVAYRFYDSTQTIVVDNTLSLTLSVKL